MKLVPKGHRHTHRGIIGVESAIVMIAFVIVAAALAFVVLNMGFATTQKAKTTIISSLGEASSSLEIAGKITGIGCTPASSGTQCDNIQRLNVTSVPLKIASGGDSVNLGPTTTAISYLSNSIEYTDIYECILTSTPYANVTLAFTGAAGDATCTSFPATDANNPVNRAVPTDTRALIYFTVDTNANSVLDQGEHAVLVIAYRDTDRPAVLDKIRAEVMVSTGAALAIERQVPNITNLVVDLG